MAKIFLKNKLGNIERISIIISRKLEAMGKRFNDSVGLCKNSPSKTNPTKHNQSAQLPNHTDYKSTKTKLRSTSSRNNEKSKKWALPYALA